jgi:Domain of unknown function (DUF4232)
MRPATSIAAVLFAAAVAVTGCTARSTPARPAASPQTPTAPTLVPAPKAPTPEPPPRGPAILRCDPSALRGSVQGTEGAMGTIWVTVQLRNVSARTCTVKGIPGVRLLGAHGQPVLPPSEPDGPAGSVVVLRSGAAARFAFGASNVCDSTVVGFSIRVTPNPGKGALLVSLVDEPVSDGLISAGLHTCRTLNVQALKLVPGSGPLVLADGRYPVLLKTVDPGRGRITFDVIQFFRDDDAAREAAKDHQEANNDHYARNVNPMLRTLPTRGDATITVNALLNTQKSIPVSLTRLATLTRTSSPMFWITVRDDQVIRIGEQWMP